MSLAIEGLVVGNFDLAISAQRDAGGDASLGQGVSEPVGVIGSVGQQLLGSRQAVDHEGGALVVAHFPFREQYQHGTSLPVADGVQLGVQAPFGTPETSGEHPPFFRRLAAVRWAFKWGASIMI